MSKFLKGSLIVVAILDLFLIAGAALRIIMEEPGSRPLFEVPYIGSTEDDYYDDGGGGYASGSGGSWTDSGSPSASADSATPPSGNQGALVGHLKGNSWENPPEPKGGGSGDDYQRAEQITDGRQGDLDDAKQRIKGLQ